jgi:uncharacterized protein (TIGR01777 family)
MDGKRKIAVTGASGLIGSALCAALEADGTEVVRLVRRDPKAGEVRWDPAAGTIDAAGLEGLDAVIHLAGEGIGERRWSAEQKRRILESRTLGTALLASTLASLDAPPPVFVSGSATGFYGERGDERLTEDSPRGAGFLADVVVGWEAATEAAEKAGIRVAHARTGVVLTPKGGALPKLLLQSKLFAGGPMGDGRQYLSWISLDDEVAALRWLVDADLAGPVNLTAPEPVTNRELVKTIGAVLRRPSFLPVPKFGPRLLLGRELADELLFTSTRAVPARLTGGGFAFSQPDLEGALRAMLGRP